MKRPQHGYSLNRFRHTGFSECFSQRVCLVFCKTAAWPISIIQQLFKKWTVTVEVCRSNHEVIPTAHSASPPNEMTHLLFVCALGNAGSQTMVHKWAKKVTLCWLCYLIMTWYDTICVIVLIFLFWALIYNSPLSLCMYFLLLLHLSFDSVLFHPD